jgi:hypothetical protein
MMSDPYKYLWREEIRNDKLPSEYPLHTYITRGTTLYGYVQRDSTDITWFKTPKMSWSPSRRRFRKLNKREIDFYIQKSYEVESFSLAA